MWGRPDFLSLPERAGKPRSNGITHLLDKGAPAAVVDGVLSGAGAYVDLVKIGWGISYLDGALKQRVTLYHEADVMVCLGGTLLEIAAHQGQVPALMRWASGAGIDAVEVSNGLCRLSPQRKQLLVRQLSSEFVVLAEAGAKDAAAPVTAAGWAQEMCADLDAGARWVIAEGRESGTVGLYEPSGAVRTALVDGLTELVPVERMIFEAPTKAQQLWFVRRFGPDVNLGNVAPEEVLALETLRLGLRADTASSALRNPLL